MEGNPACCRKFIPLGLVDCAACLDEAWSGFSERLSPEERDDAQWIIDTVCQAGAAGIRKSKLMVRLVSGTVTMNSGLCISGFHSSANTLDSEPND